MPSFPKAFVVIATFFVSFVALACRAHAIPADGSEALIREGLALRRNGNDEGALEKFTQAAAIRRSGRALAQIALAEQAIGRWVEAEDHLKEALALREEAWIAKNSPLLQSALADISSHLGMLEISGNVSGATVKVNGTARGRLPLREPLRVPLGTVMVELEAQGHFPLARSVVVLAGSRARESLNMVPSGQAPSSAFAPTPLPAVAAAAPEPSLADSATATQPSSSSWQRPTAIVSVVAAGALLVYGGIAHWQREQTVSAEREKEASGQSHCGQTGGGGDCANLRKDVKDRETQMMIGYGAAAALAATGGVLFWMAPARQSSAELVNVALFARGTF